MTYRRKLIEVALPLEAINIAAAREKAIRQGHPSTLHVWWARRPLAACRAVLFASLVDDPSARPEEFASIEEQDAERSRLFRILEELVIWENSTNERVLRAARREIVRSCGDAVPELLDPFCGGGSIPLEAQRLGIRAHGSDLNPIPVLITKALIEIPARFAGRRPVAPADAPGLSVDDWSGARGLAADIRYYGEWMRRRAEESLGDLYPNLAVSNGGNDRELPVLAWLWARTIPCPNPACGIQLPLVRSWALSTKPGRQFWVEPEVDRSSRKVRYRVQAGPSARTDGTTYRGGAVCIGCDTPVNAGYIRSQGQAGHMSTQLMALVATEGRGRLYFSPTPEQEQVAADATAPPDVGLELLSTHPQYMGTPRYGLTRFRDLFTPRQLATQTLLCDLVAEAAERVRLDAHAVMTEADAREYSRAVALYLAFAVDGLANLSSALASWRPVAEAARTTFGRQAVSMVWDFCEVNPLADKFAGCVDRVADVVAALRPAASGRATQSDARAPMGSDPLIISTDPPYYDNVPYADLSDFFYIWLRRSVGRLYPDECATLLVPKTQELVANTVRQGGKEQAQQYFEQGLHDVFTRMLKAHDPRFPLTVFYAFRQSEDQASDLGTVSSGWETMLEGLLAAGWMIEGTWPMRTEGSGRLRSLAANALASSIVLVCRPRPARAGLATRKEFAQSLRNELPEALRALQQANIAPVDLAQCAIGPGMAVFSRFARVIDAEGRPMPVRAALGLINQVLDELVTEQEGDLDADTRWAMAWFEQFGFEAGPFGMAETLSKAKNTAVAGLVESGIARAPAGKVRLVRPQELDPDWDPRSARRITVWEITHQLSHALDTGGEGAAARLLAPVGGLADAARDLAYRLYLICDRKRWPKEAVSYNSLVVAWPELVARAANDPATGPVQQLLET